MRDIDDKALDALCERLRVYLKCWGDEPSIAPHCERAPGMTTGQVIFDANQAADVIATLRARLREVEAEMDKLANRLDRRVEDENAIAKKYIELERTRNGMFAWPDDGALLAKGLEREKARAEAAEAREAKLREALKRIVKADEARDEATIQYAKIIRTGDDPSAHDKCISTNNEFWGAIDAARAAAQEDGVRSAETKIKRHVASMIITTGGHHND